MKKIDQHALRLEIGKLSLGNFGIHIMGVFELWWCITSIMTVDVLGIVLSGIFGLYFAYKLSERQHAKKALLTLVKFDEDER